MTAGQSIDLLGLLRKAGVEQDTDFLRERVRVLTQALMEALSTCAADGRSGPVCDTWPMKVTPAAPDYTGHRYPPEIIAHAVGLYFRFALSYRDVEELLAERGVVVTYETIRQWCRKFGQTYANELRRRRPRPGDKWHLDTRLLMTSCPTKILPTRPPSA